MNILQLRYCEYSGDHALLPGSNSYEFRPDRSSAEVTYNANLTKILAGAENGEFVRKTTNSYLYDQL